MAVEGAFAFWGSGPVDVGPDFGDDGRAEGDVRDEVSVHDVDVQPVCALGNGGGAGEAEGGEISREDAGGYFGEGRHAGW